ncbi:MAG: transcription termination/antitermination protein NusA [Alphaproteobacteria bacterium]|nr:MAG: transcription termination/antitermination protein NusA [Alphaproteobacteria bacterium]
MVGLSFGSSEIIQIADAVAREKQIDRQSVIDAMAQAVQIAGRKKYGTERDIRAYIDNKTGEIQLFRVITVVEEIEDEMREMSLSDAKRLDATYELGTEIKEPLPPIDFGRIAAQTAKQVIVQKVRDAERMRQYNEYKDRVGEIISGVVKRMEYGNVTVDFGNAEGFIRKQDLIPREIFRTGDRIRAYISEVSSERAGSQVVLSRTHPEFMRKLFAMEVPEIYDGAVEIVSVARDPGSRAKIAVRAKEFGVNPVLACVGVRGARVQAVVNELQGEKVDIIEHSNDPANYIVNAISSAEVTKVVLDEEANRVEVVVPDEQLSMAIGRRGQNVRLASMLTGWSIDILTDAEESERRTGEFDRLSGVFVEALNVEEVIAHLLVTEGFTSIEEVAYVPLEDLATIEGFDEDVANELRNRARDWLETQEKHFHDKIEALGISEDLLKMEGLEGKRDLIITLAEGGVKTREDLADLATDEFIELVPKRLSGMSFHEVESMIMKARELEHWFDGETSETPQA